MSVGSRQRARIRRALAVRDGAACWYCATPFGPGLDGATIDHLVPRSAVPTWVLAALVLACGPCNEAKGDRPPAALLRPEPGRFGPGLTVPTRTHGHADPRTRARVREAGVPVKELAPVG